MAASYGAVTITSTATSVLVPTVSGRRGFILANNGLVTAYFGFDSAVTTSNGIQLLPQEKYEDEGDDAAFKGSVYAITSGSNTELRYWNWSE